MIGTAYLGFRAVGSGRRLKWSAWFETRRRAALLTMTKVVSSTLADYASGRRHARAVGEDGGVQGAAVDAEVFGQDALEQGAHVQGGRCVAVLEQPGLLQGGPVADDAGLPQAAAQDQGGGGGAVVGAPGAVDMGGAAELGGGDDHRVGPFGAQA